MLRAAHAYTQGSSCKLGGSARRISQMADDAQTLTDAQAAVIKLGIFPREVVMKMTLAQLYAAIDLARLSHDATEPREP